MVLAARFSIAEVEKAVLSLLDLYYFKTRFQGTVALQSSGVNRRSTYAGGLNC